VCGVVVFGESFVIGFCVFSVFVNYVVVEEVEGDVEFVEIGWWVFVFVFFVVIGFVFVIFKVGLVFFMDLLLILNGNWFVFVEGFVCVMVFVLYLIVFSFILLLWCVF